MARNYLEDKFTVQVSGNTVQRFRHPTNAKTASNMTQFIFDHKQQSAHIPDRLRKTLIEATQKSSSGRNKMSTNHKTDKAAAFGPLAKAQLGGTPDEPGRY